MFLFELQQWLSPHSQLVAELVLGKIHPNEIFSGAPGTWCHFSSHICSKGLNIIYVIELERVII